MNAIQIEKLIKKFGSVHALDGLDLEIEQGTVFGFLGPNGAGKTTTLRILAGLAKPDSGSVMIDGKTFISSTPAPSPKIGYLPEEPAFYGWMSPIEFLDYVGKIFKLETKDRKVRIAELLELTGLKDSSKRRIGGFSRGMRQRLGMAQALVNKPEILLLDEPVSALDPVGRKEVLELIEKLASTCTVVMSSHILADVERVCDTVAIINKGKRLVQARKENLMNQYAIPALELEVYNGAAAGIPELAERIRKISSVSGVVIEGYKLRIAVKDVRSAQQSIMQDALTHNLPFERLEIVKPSLEDIFMQLVATGEEK